jgi:hypothetical protein
LIGHSAAKPVAFDLRSKGAEDFRFWGERSISIAKFPIDSLTGWEMEALLER